MKKEAIEYIEDDGYDEDGRKLVRRLFCCPTCNKRVFVGESECPECGQKLIWR